MTDKIPQPAISEDGLRLKCLEAIRRDPEAAKMARIGHERGVIILVALAMKDLYGDIDHREVRQEMLRCLKS